MENLSKDFWTTTELHRLFKFGEKFKNEKTLVYAEEKGLIPVATRVARGNIQVRKWTTNQLPEIGKQFGFLKSPKKKQVITFYTSKGGVLKTSTAHNKARMLALNGIKTLIIGLDTIQESITDLTLPQPKIESLEQLNEEIPGLYHYFYEDHPLESIIKKTSLPTLDIIPENPELAQLEIKFSNSPRREYFFLEKLIDKLNYDVIIFDNGAGFTRLVQNSLTASNVVICPMGCTQLAYRAINKNVSLIKDFAELMKLKWDHFIQIATLKNKNTISEKIYNDYIKRYSENMISLPIRQVVAGDEAAFKNISVIEHDPSSQLAQDYYNLISAIWSRINNYENEG